MFCILFLAVIILFLKMWIFGIICCNFCISRKKWNAKLNDQDIFNAVLSISPQHLMILPCSWNVQLHARLNTFMLCLDEVALVAGTDQTKPVISYANQVPYNCPQSIENDIFVCTNRAKVLHFMAQTWYSYDFLRYYANFWRMYADLSWSLLIQTWNDVACHWQ